MSNFQKLLITFGAFWLSLQTVVLFAWIFGKLNTGVIYGDGVLDAIAMGVMTSMGRALAAALGTAIVALSIDSPKPERWAFIVAFLYVSGTAIRLLLHWHSPSRRWYLLSLGTDLFWPAVVSIATAAATAHLQRKTHTPQITT
jgi:hypothetical protein